jgi:hypothetical protein
VRENTAFSIISTVRIAQRLISGAGVSICSMSTIGSLQLRRVPERDALDP